MDGLERIVIHAKQTETAVGARYFLPQKLKASQMECERCSHKEVYNDES